MVKLEGKAAPGESTRVGQGVNGKTTVGEPSAESVSVFVTSPFVMNVWGANKSTKRLRETLAAVSNYPYGLLPESVVGCSRFFIGPNTGARASVFGMDKVMEGVAVGHDQT
jgi:hypothetical protein